jgi:flagellar motor protein MotB
MANDIVNTYSDALFDLYKRLNLPSKKGSQNGWPYCQTETGLRVFQEAAEPHISGTTQSATSSSSPSPPPRLQSRPIWLQTFWPVWVGALVVICCVLALAWQAHRPAPANARLQPQDTEIAQTWREASPQLVQSLLAEVRVLNSNQAALATSQVQIGAGLATLSNIATQLAALASTQANATRGLAAAQTALAQETTNLVASLRQTFQQGLAKTASQSRADTVKLQTQVADVEASLRQTFQQGLTKTASQSHADTVKLQTQVADVEASLRQTFQQGLTKTASQSRADTLKLQTQVADVEASLRRTFKQELAEAASQSRADTVKLETQVAEVAASHRALLDRLSGPTNVLSLALALPGVRTKTFGNSILVTFDDGLFLHGTYFKPDAKSRLQVVANALAQASRHLRIEVIGCADDDCASKSRKARFEESLALERASAVVNYFIELGLFAPKRLAALSSRGTDRPFPSDTVQNRAKNRTAMLRISREEEPMTWYDEPAP